jgi:limonene-1,2-epoxide hydrolase
MAAARRDVDQGEPMTPEETVNAFIAAVTGGDTARAAELAADDIVYENIGFGRTSFEAAHPTINGSSAMLDFLAALQDQEWVVHRETRLGNVVINERTDKLTFNGTSTELLAAGVFEVVDGKITFWRDYCDMQALDEQLSGT